MRIRTRVAFGLVAYLCFAVAHAGAQTEPFSKIPSAQRETLTKRLNAYVQAYRERKWEQLYELVSSRGKGGADQNVFVAAMQSEHGTDFAQMPDLLEFRPELAHNDKGEFDIYGCGKATREGAIFNGVAVTHAVFEHDEWFFTGWSFTEFPNEPCEALSDPHWQPANLMAWNRPMEEIEHFKSRGISTAAPNNAPKDKPVVANAEQTKKLEEAIAPYVKKARESLPEAKNKYIAGLPKNQSFFVTIKLYDASKKYVVVFVNVTSWRGGSIYGILDSDLTIVQNHSKGEKLTCQESEVLDWTISKPDGTEEGNFVGKFLDTYKP